MDAASAGGPVETTSAEGASGRTGTADPAAEGRGGSMEAAVSTKGRMIERAAVLKLSRIGSAHSVDR